MGCCDSIGNVYRQRNWSNCSGMADAKERLQLCIFILVLCIFGRLSTLYDPPLEFVVPCSPMPVSSSISWARRFVEDYAEYTSDVPQYIQAHPHGGFACVVQPRYVIALLCSFELLFSPIFSDESIFFNVSTL